MRLLLTLFAGLLLVAAGALEPGDAGAQAGRAPLSVRLFAPVGPPGHPDPIAVDRDGTVYVGTLTSLAEMTLGRSSSGEPSSIFAFGPDGGLRRRYVVAGQSLDEEHGLLGMAFDATGRLYVTDANPARVLTLDPVTGSQREYARFRDLSPCPPLVAVGDCSFETIDRKPLPNGAAFGPDGSLYVTDYRQGVIWRIPNGGGVAEVWLKDPGLASFPFALNGIRLGRGGATLLFVQTNTSGPAGRIYEVGLRHDGTPGPLRLLYETKPFDGPDSFAIANSGNLYVALAGANQLLKLSPDGRELARVPATPLDNLGLEVPFDVPADVAFLGRHALVTNSSFIAANPASWAVLDIWAGEPGLPPLRPHVGTGGARRAHAG